MIRTLVLSAVALAATPVLAGSSLAQSSGETGTVSYPGAVYELFTSQGCSSCPPANAQITALSDDEDVLALSYGVTYWDYLGWKDTFAKPEFTARQRAYVKAMGARNAYTPQIVVNGESHSSRLRKQAVRELGKADGLTLSEADGILRADGEGDALLVTYMPGTHSVAVKRGENGGRTLELSNVVQDVQTVRLPHSFEAVPGESYAVIAHGRDLSVASAAVWTRKG